MPFRHGHRLSPDAGNAEKFPTADIPSLATGGAPEDLGANPNGVSTFSRNTDFDLAGDQIEIVQQTDASRGDVAAKSRLAGLALVDRRGPKK